MRFIDLFYPNGYRGSRGYGVAIGATSHTAREAGLDVPLKWVAAFLAYCLLSVLILGRGLFGGFSTRYIGWQADPALFMWFLEWWKYVFAHHVNPFLTHLVWAPAGFNMAWATSIPLAAIPAIPLTKSIGPVATYNLLVLLCAPLAAIAASALCLRVCGSFKAALLGGYLFGFSPFMLAQAPGHLTLALLFPIPLAAYLVVQRLEERLGAATFAALFALALVAEFLLSIELFATMSVVGAFALAAALYFAEPQARSRLLTMVAPVAAAYAVAAVLLSPYLYYLFAFGFPGRQVRSPGKFSIDLLNFMVPTPVNLAGANRWLGSFSLRFGADLFERDGFMLPLIVVIELWRRRHHDELLCKVLTTTFAFVCVCTMGPFLKVAGASTTPMPWLLIGRLPLLKHVVPARLMLFAFLIAAVIFCLWLVDAASTKRTRVALGAATILLMLPNPVASFWISPVRGPAFFTNGSCERELSPKDVVLLLPWGDDGPGMLWQAQCGMGFRNVGGYTGIARFRVRRWPIVSWFMGSHDLPELDLQFKAFLARMGVTAIVIDDSDRHASSWNALAATLGVPRLKTSGVSLYRIPPDLLERYRGMTGRQMEARANRLRFATLLAATASYLAAGNDPANLNAKELVRLKLLPQGWDASTGHPDMYVAPWPGHGIVIAELGSPSGLQGVIRRYRHWARTIYYPVPHILTGTSRMTWRQRLIAEVFAPPFGEPTDGESIQILAVVFDIPELRSAARELGTGAGSAAAAPLNPAAPRP